MDREGSGTHYWDRFQDLWIITGIYDCLQHTMKKHVQGHPSQESHEHLAPWHIQRSLPHPTTINSNSLTYSGVSFLKRERAIPHRRNRRNLDRKGLIIYQVPMKNIQLHPRHRINNTLNRTSREEVAR